MVAKECFDARRLVKKWQRPFDSSSKKVAQASRMARCLLGNRGQCGSNLFGFDNADGFLIDEQWVVTGPRAGHCSDSPHGTAEHLSEP